MYDGLCGITVTVAVENVSPEENGRIGRTPQQVMDDAMWGIFETGWRSRWGADADHVKELSHVAPFVAAGYTFFTIDPSDHVDNDAPTDDLDTLRQKTAVLPWQQFGTTAAEMITDYCAAPIVLAGTTLQFDEEVLLRALAKYGRALAYTLTLTTEIRRQMVGKPFDLEMSVDETDTPTSAEEHYFIAHELLKRDVPVVSLAPRFVGKFQKGVDYMGDLGEFVVLPGLLDDFDARQLLHVTFGSALDEYGVAIKADLLADEAAYEAVLVTHFGRHYIY